MFVIWNDASKDQLTEFYVSLSLDEQRTLAHHVVGINGQLQERGWELGESRGANRRLWFTEWLVVSFVFTAFGIEVVFVSSNR